MTFVARLAWRSLWRHRRRTLITVVSIGLGLACVVFLQSLANGMYRQLVGDAVRMQAGHLTLEDADYRDAPAVALRLRDADARRRRIEGMPGVAGTKLLVSGQGVASSATGTAGVTIVGVEPEVEARHSPLPRRVVAGTWLGGAAGDVVPRVMVGALLAERLGLAPERKLVLTTNDAAGQLTETLVRVQGIFRTGAEDVDGYLVVAPLDAARRVFGLEPDAATQLGVLLDEPDDAPAVARAIRAAIPERDVAVLRWQEVLPDLAAFIRIDRTSDSIFQGMLLFLILFTIFNTLLMSVLERTREFAVQLALGTPPRLLRLQLLFESMLLGLLGCTLGAVVGGGVALWVEAHGWDMRGLYREGLTVSGFAVDTLLRAHPTPRLVLGLAGIVFAATLLASLPPMRRAVRVRLAEVLR